MKTVRQTQNIEGKRVLVRGSLNVPVRSGRVANDFRLRKTLPTLKFLQDKGARIILMGHIADAGGDTLEPVAEYLQQHIELTFVKDFLGLEGQKAVSDMKEGDIVLFENTRTDPREKGNDAEFAQALAAYGDYYINESFASSHREHASIVGIPQHLPSYAGLQFESELKHLSLALDPPRPYMVVLGGIKESKLFLAKKMLGIADSVFVGGALANDFFKAKGLPVNDALTSGTDYNLEEVVGHEKLFLPLDVSGVGFTKKVEDIKSEDMILDIGPDTLSFLETKVSENVFILWNGPIGDYAKGFGEQNEMFAAMVANSSAQSVVGGGDTVDSISGLGLEDAFTFVSTAGGSMIQFLSDGTLPGIKALEDSQKKFSL